MLYVALDGKLEAKIVFPALAYFTVLRVPLMVLPSCYTAITDAYVAMKRIEKFLLAEEAAPIPPPVPDHEFAMSIKNASFLWDQLPAAPKEGTEGGARGTSGNNDSSDEATITNETHPYLCNVNLQIPRGSLVAVVGPVGSGKSSLLQAMVGNMTMSQGEVIRGTNVSYASQTAWIQNATIRDNILFDTPMDEERYRRVIKACCLEQDLKLFPFGDQTEIGERGVNLSGGQKARLSLARSVYFNAGTVILDDPLSAVDAHVGKKLWEDCVMSELKGRTRVIATHQLHVLPDVDYIICMQNGIIAEEGTFKELMANNGDFCALMERYGGVQAEDEKEEAVLDAMDSIESEKAMFEQLQRIQSRTETIRTARSAHGSTKDGLDKDRRDSVEAAESKPQKLMTDEERESGAVKGNVYKGYLKASGQVLWSSVFAFFLLQQIANVM